MDEALRDAGLVELIVQFLGSDIDRRCAALVCRVWSEAVASTARKLVVRARPMRYPRALRVGHITELDLALCTDQLGDCDLGAAAAAFRRLRVLRVGGADVVQRRVTESGVAAFAKSCSGLEEVELSWLPSLCDSGVAALVRGCGNLRALRLEDCRILGDVALEAIAGGCSLQALTLIGEFKFTSSGLAVIGERCPGLVKLELDLLSVNIDPVLKSVAQGCRRLEEVALTFETAHLGELAHCTSLHSLAISSSAEPRLDEAVVAIAASNRNLVEFTCLYRLSDSAVMSLIFKCPQLQRLHLDAFNLTEGVLPCIQRCDSLTDLLLDNFQSTGQGLAEIGLCGLDFRSFSLTHARGVRDTELQTLIDGNQQLENLDLRGCFGPTAIGYSAIALCSRLQSLDLSHTTVDDLTLITIASRVTSLKDLTLVKCDLISSMSAVARFSSLESLTLDHCRFVTDEGLDILSRKCPRITHLSLASTNITDAGLVYLSKCQTLRSLRIPYCKHVQGSGLVSIAKAVGWLHYVVASHRFRWSSQADVLRRLSCTVRFEMDETALVPFGAFISL